MNNIARLMKVIILSLTSLLIYSIPSESWAETLTVEIEISNHFFVPSKINIPADTKVRLVIFNRDNTSEEFESYQLNREKVIMGNRKGTIFIGPLHPGEYPFFGEFNQKTAQGVVVVK